MSGVRLLKEKMIYHGKIAVAFFVVAFFGTLGFMCVEGLSLY